MSLYVENVQSKKATVEMYEEEELIDVEAALRRTKKEEYAFK